MSNNSKNPKGSEFCAFETFGGPIQQCVMPIIAKVDDNLYPVGTGFAISGTGLFITAAHVLEEAARKSVPRQRNDGTLYDHYELLSLFVSSEIDPEGKNYIGGLIPLEHLAVPEEIDLALCCLRLPIDKNTNRKLKISVARIGAIVPQIGDEILALGYYSMSGSFTGEVCEGSPIIEYAQKTAQVRGVVEEVHPIYLDSSMRPFPCFRTNCQFNSGMSGGPIFHASGSVFGVVTTGGEGLLADISYGSLIWPAFAMKIEVTLQDGGDPVVTTLYDLANTNRIHVDETMKNLNIEEDEHGKRTITYRSVPES